MTHSRAHSYGNKIGGQEQQRSPFENLPLKFQRQSSKENRELITDVRSAVFSHLGVDPAESTQPAQSPVELHVHHHHHLYVDNEQQPSSPRTTDGDLSAGKSNVASKINWKDYEEVANKTLLDLLWAKNQPYYSTGNRRKPWKKANSVELQPASCVSTVEPCPGVAKRPDPSQLGKEKKQTPGKATKSKIRYLEETAQERIKKLSDLGTLVSKAEAEWEDESRSSCGVLRRKEAASQTHMEQCKYLSRNRPKEEVFKEESEAAEAGFVAALTAAKDRLRELVNECARANGVPENVLRKQKELQALEMLQYYFHNQDTSSAGASTARPSTPVTESPSTCSEILSSEPMNASAISDYMSPDQSFTPSNFQQPPSLERRPKPEPESKPEPDDSKEEDAWHAVKSTSSLLVYESDVESPKISSTAEYMKLFERYQVAPQIGKETATATASSYPWTTAVKSELAKLVSGLSLNKVEVALQNVERKLANVEKIRDQAVEAVRKWKEAFQRSAKDKSKAVPEKVAEPVKEKLKAPNVCEEPKPECSSAPVGFTLFNSPIYEPRDGSKEELVDMLSVVITESERLESFLGETKQRFMAEDRKNTLLKECVGDPSLYQKEHAILDSALMLNSELLDNLSGMDYALTSYGTAMRNLLPFVEEHLAITERLREAASTPHTGEVRVPSTSSTVTSCRGKTCSLEVNTLPSIWEEQPAFEDTVAAENSDLVQLRLIREIEETKKQSREMVEIMDSLGHHYNVLREKFTQMGTEVAHESDPSVDKLLTDGDSILKGAELIQNSLSSGDDHGRELSNVQTGKRTMELEKQLNSLEQEISLSHENIQKLKSQTQQVKTMMESKEQEADSMRRQTDEIQYRILQLEEELKGKARQIAALKEDSSPWSESLNAYEF